MTQPKEVFFSHSDRDRKSALQTAPHVLITTRASSWPGAGTAPIDTLDPADAVAFLRERTGQSDTVAAERVATLLGNLPLALEQAAAYTLARKKTLADYARLLEERGLTLLEKGKAHNYPASIGTTWNLAFAALDETPGARELLELCAFLAPEPIDLADLSQASRTLADQGKPLPDPLGDVLSDELRRDDVKEALLRYSLASASGESISVHRLVQQVTCDRIAAERREAFLLAALRAVNAAFPFESGDVRTWPGCQRWLAHALVVTGYEAAERLDPRAVGRLLNAAAVHLNARADYAQAEPLYRRALAIDEAALGPEHPNVAIRLNNLALLLQGKNRVEEAEPLYRRALAIDEAALGPEHPNVATRLNNLAGLLRATTRVEEAELLLRRALAIDEAALGREHPNVAIRLNNLAQLLKETSRVEEAEPLLRRALSILEASFGAEHPLTVTARRNLERLLAARR